MKRYLLTLTLCFTFIAALVSCSDDDKPKPVYSQLEKPVLSISEQTENSLTFAWTSVEGADFYTYVFNGGEEIKYSLNSIKIENLEPGTYTFKVCAKSDNKDVPVSDWAEITATIDAPDQLAAPVLTLAEQTDSKFVFTWEAVEGADFYTYTFNSDEEQKTEETTLTFEELTSGSYTLKVKAVSNDTKVPASDWAEITAIIGDQLAAPVVKLDAQTINSLTFGWDAVDNADAYVYVFDEGKEVTTTETSVTFKDLAAGEHTIKVKAVSNDVKIPHSEWTEAKGTIYSQLATPKPTLDGQGRDFANIVWKAIENADYYIYTVDNSQEFTTENAAVTLTNLVAGEHVFKVKAVSNNENVPASEWAEVKFVLDSFYIEFSFSDVSSINATINAKPSENNRYYYFAIEKESVYRSYGSDDAFLAYVIDDITKRSAEAEMTYAEGIKTVRSIGEDSWRAGSLDPATKYIAYGFAIDATTGVPTSGLYTKEFSTNAAPTNIITLGNVEPYKFDFTISTPNEYHKFVPVKKALFEMWGQGALEYLANFGIQNYGVEHYYWEKGQTLGDTGLPMEVDPDTDFLIFACVTNEAGTSYGPIETIEFHTPALPTLENPVTIEITKNADGEADAAITIANAGVATYIAFHKDLAWHNNIVDNYGEGQLRSTIAAALTYGLASQYSESTTYKMKGLKPGTDYVVYALVTGVDGSQTLVTKTFTAN